MTPVVLRTGPLYRCERCNVRFASAAEAQLCPLCTLRAEQRLGGKMPPGLQRRLARMVRR
jgi:hypothetical protein